MLMTLLFEELKSTVVYTVNLLTEAAYKSKALRNFYLMYEAVQKFDNTTTAWPLRGRGTKVLAVLIAKRAVRVLEEKQERGQPSSVTKEEGQELRNKEQLDED